MSTEILKNAVLSDGSLEREAPYIFWDEGETVNLAGEFSLADLEAIIPHVRAQTVPTGGGASPRMRKEN